MIKFENVDKVYEGGVHALDNVTLEIDQGEFVAIIGLSGAGKSTLIRTVNKMHDITGGKLTVNGLDVSKKALEALDKLGILDKAYVRADKLSGGQMQRVALARTLAQDPEIILADEPVASLDPVVAAQVMGDFKTINQDYNITVIINIHHVDLALKYADRIIGINAGKIIYDGPSANVTEAVLEEIYGGKLEEGDFNGNT